MNTTIMKWCSEAMYDSKLKADVSVASSTLKSKKKDYIEKVQEELEESIQLISKDMLLIDTAGCSFGESMDSHDENDSKYNIGEVSIIELIIKQLKELNVSDTEIGVITPYNAQVQQLRKTLYSFTQAEISTVDGFQGREKEVIIISMVRSNPDHCVGFLSNSRRMNVAITRAKTFVVIICDSVTVSSDSFLGNIVKYIIIR